MALNGKPTFQKRSRPQLSCKFCRTGKLKCDRNSPCNQCIKRSRESQCVYLAPPPRKSKSTKNPKDRIAHLEDLVIQLINQNNDASGEQSNSSLTLDNGFSKDGTALTTTDQSSFIKNIPSSSATDSSDTATAFGQMKITHGSTSYVGAAHWEAILNGIEDLKATFKDNEEFERDSSSSTSADTDDQGNEVSEVLLRDLTPVSREYLLQSVPSKEIGELMLWNFFNSSNPTLAAIHKPTFLGEYKLLREEPSKVPTMWLAMYFGMLSIGCQVAVLEMRHSSVEPVKESHENARLYRTLCAKALTLADYTHPKKYTVEALLVYATALHLDHCCNPLSLWLVLGSILRVSLRMGYHREPSHSSFLSPFEGEMRRRIWNIVYIFDVLSSFAIGLPDMIRQVQSDIRQPSNLLDTDFGPKSAIIPPSRPTNEISQITFSIVKSDITRVFARAADISHSVTPPEYSTVRALDMELDKVHKEIPDPLRYVPMELSISDPTSIIYNRFKLELIYQKTKCVLHRRYLMITPTDDDERKSQVKCVNAAVSILEHLETIYFATRDGGQLSNTPYFLNSSGSQDFLLAGMIICLALNRFGKSQMGDFVSLSNAQKMRRLLETAYQAYTSPVMFSQPPENAVKALELIIGKMPPQGSVDGRKQTNNAVQESNFTTDQVGDLNPFQIGTDLSQTFTYQPNTALFDFDTSLDWDYFDSVIREPEQAGNQPSTLSTPFNGISGLDESTMLIDPLLQPGSTDWSSIT